MAPAVGLVAGLLAAPERADHDVFAILSRFDLDVVGIAARPALDGGHLDLVAGGAPDGDRSIDVAHPRPTPGRELVGPLEVGGVLGALRARAGERYGDCRRDDESANESADETAKTNGHLDASPGIDDDVAAERLGGYARRSRARGERA